VTRAVAASIDSFAVNAVALVAWKTDTEVLVRSGDDTLSLGAARRRKSSAVVDGCALLRWCGIWSVSSLALTEVLAGTSVNTGGMPSAGLGSA